MTWIPAFREPWAWGLLAAVPVVILLLYFLKLRRIPVEVPSTYLWTKTIEDLHVNSLLQRLRRSLLLLLQLLVVLLAAIALFRPGVRDEGEERQRLVFLLDASASMAARDAGARENRFEQARRRIAERIGAMTDRESAMLIRFSDGAEVLQPFTSDRRRLREALSRAMPSQRTTDLSEALQLADGLTASRRRGERLTGELMANQVDGVALDGANVGEDMTQEPAAEASGAAEVALYSDGGFASIAELDLAHLSPRYHAVGSDRVTNLAITAFSADRNPNQPGEVSVVATVANLGTLAASTSATLTSGEVLLDAAALELDPGQETGLAFTIQDEEAASLKLSLEIDDALEVDNHAYAGLLPPRTVNVLVVTPGNLPLELGLGTARAAEICRVEFMTPGYMETDAYAARAAAGVDDLIIFDRCSPPRMPQTSTFFIGELPPERWSWQSESAPPIVIDLDRTHPLMRYIELYSLLIFEGRALSGPPGMKVLVGGDAGPLLGMAQRESFRDLVLGFPILVGDASEGMQANTNWYAERSWPVFLLNVLRTMAGAVEASGTPSYRPGETIRLRTENLVERVTVRRIGGPEWQLDRGPLGSFEFVATDEPGQYLVESDGRLIDAFSVNLFDRQESQLAVVPQVRLGGESVAAATTGAWQRREYWRWLLVAMLGLLVAEWWIYSRRLG